MKDSRHDMSFIGRLNSVIERELNLNNRTANSCVKCCKGTYKKDQDSDIVCSNCGHVKIQKVKSVK